jgi:hypothetical protein
MYHDSFDVWIFPTPTSFESPDIVIFMEILPIFVQLQVHFCVLKSRVWVTKTNTLCFCSPGATREVDSREINVEGFGKTPYSCSPLVLFLRPHKFVERKYVS